VEPDRQAACFATHAVDQLQIKVIEPVLCRERDFPGRSWNDAVELSGQNQLLPGTSPVKQKFADHISEERSERPNSDKEKR
jgi:hypothetical protein